jgi:DNA-binding MarR family transcriptional regulator
MPLTPLAKRVLLALVRAPEPGEMAWSALRENALTSDQALARVANRLEDDGLVVQDGWDGAKYSTVRLTGPGHELCACRGWRPMAAST